MTLALPSISGTAVPPQGSVQGSPQAANAALVHNSAAEDVSTLNALFTELSHS